MAPPSLPLSPPPAKALDFAQPQNKDPLCARISQKSYPLPRLLELLTNRDAKGTGLAKAITALAGDDGT